MGTVRREVTTGWGRPLPGLAMMAIVACAGAEASNLAVAVVDSLPGGIPRVTSPGPTGWTDSSGARLVEINRFSGVDGESSEIGQPQSLAVDAAGRIYVADTKPAVVKVYSPGGELIRTIGHEGEGPGEFRIGFIASRGPHLVLHDPRLSRTTLFDTAGTFIRSWRTSCCYWTDIQIDSADRIYVPSMVVVRQGEQPRGRAYVRWTSEGTVIDTVWIPHREEGKVWTVSLKGPDGKMMSSMSTGIPLMPSLAGTLHPEGGVVFGWGGEYALVRSNTGFDSVRVMARAWTPEQVDDARRKSEVEAMIKEASEGFTEENVRSAFKLEDVPSTLPAFRTIKVDPQGRIWVRRYTVDKSVVFDVFGPDGAFLGPVRSPVEMNEWGGMQVWTNDGLVALIEDDDGRPTVVRLKLEFGRD